MNAVQGKMASWIDLGQAIPTAGDYSLEIAHETCEQWRQLDPDLSENVLFPDKLDPRRVHSHVSCALLRRAVPYSASHPHDQMCQMFVEALTVDNQQYCT